MISVPLRYGYRCVSDMVFVRNRANEKEILFFYQRMEEKKKIFDRLVLFSL